MAWRVLRSGPVDIDGVTRQNAAQMKELAAVAHATRGPTQHIVALMQTLWWMSPHITCLFRRPGDSLKGEPHGISHSR